jgi:hypothetical protein
MTCIVGVVTRGKGVVLGGDSLGSSGWDGTERKDPKVFRLSREVACGFTSSYRMGQILRYHVTLPPLGKDEYAWAVRDFIPQIREAFKEHGYTKVDNSVETGGVFLLAVRDRLFRVDNDFQVGEAAAPFESCGCGEDYALGALHILGNTGAARHRVKRALEAASRFSNGVGGALKYVETKA